MRIILNRVVLLVIILHFLTSCEQTKQEEAKLKLWYTKPAKVWDEALPIGNGRIAAMVFGDPAKERIQLNEETFWSGGPSENNNPEALKVLPEVRKLIFDGKTKEAEDLINKHLRAGQLHGSMFQSVGDLRLIFPENHSDYSEYYRELDIQNALFSCTYKVEDVKYKREIFASIPDQLIVIKLTSDKKGMINFSTGFESPLQVYSKAVDSNTLEIECLSGTHEGVEGQVKAFAQAKILNTGGSTSIDSNKIKVNNANQVVILLSMATNFVDYQTLTADAKEKCLQYLSNAESKSWSDFRKDHISAYQNYFKRVNFDLGSSPASEFPTDERIKNFAQTYDPELITLYYQFGRYLLISSSQPGGQPANLQGVWNGQTHPAWDSKYTININTEMNYWPAEKCNLQEMHEPLITMVKELAETGKETAKTMYGCNGWVAHHNTDIWRINGVVDGAFWGMWPMGGAWLSQHLWEKFLYSGDKEYLESVFPVLLSACEFYRDFLIEEPENKWLVVSPSISPENAPQGHGTSVTYGTTMDNQILFDLFSKTITAARLLNKEQNLIAELQNILDRLPPMQIGQYGQLQEWIKDWDNPEDKHRHVSHLYGLYPSNQISPYRTPALFDAARTSLIQRGDVSTGWSMGWKVNLWARLLDGNHAMKLITDQLTLVDPGRPGYNGGTYPNLFDAHPPFQIDGNFGCTSGITEMLMQSHDGAIHILPALPDIWTNEGEISGLRTPGGFEVSFTWKNGEIEELQIISTLGGNCRIRVPNSLELKNGEKPAEAKSENANPFFATPLIKKPLISKPETIKEINLKKEYSYDIPTEKGKKYILVTNKKQ
ncbi:MAG: glycoside hydrolase family 95 protein [Bacteroidales bacterium]|nr:glycoside hydrolase family 95 protein [Bacteroidales bacterium]MBN2820942.1 glycoside hydrolase family 95 protein [Bacteroidales bacterium]